jgi:hypothetical protein
MKPCWEQQGLGPKGAELADAVIDDMCALLKRLNNDEGIANVVFTEAWFRQIELPTRSEDFRKKYLRENA